ncbi:hypothetical protein K0T92_03655 [Paenibacillus oenotherae]|uniref:Uncharacterized protein n=1 Tax=Paenibacillus oenotherae TaxID=1435645 RepID=A0ABS7D1Q4_9BACL|nr:hypothetical protein [Paenibacillus oenotherae]MBW7473838.1 hypothetical protein [Paenibacillus oenotherae]
MNSSNVVLGRNTLKLPIILLIFSLIGGIGLNVVIYFVYNSKAKVVEEYELERARLERRINTLEQQKEARVIKQADIDKLLTRVPVHAEATHYLTNLTEAEKKSGATILNINVDEPSEIKLSEPAATQSEPNASSSETSTQTDASSTDVIPANPTPKVMSQDLQLTIQGEPEQLKSYLESLLDLERLTIINEVSIKVNTDEPSEMSINMNHYWAPGYAEVLAPNTQSKEN